MAVNVALKNPATGEVKFVKVGFSWVLFFFSNVLGIPLFIRQLYRWGFTVLAINIQSVVLPLMMSRDGAMANHILTFLAQTVVMFYLGFKGNELTAKNLLAQSWQFAEPQSEAVRYAKMKWQVFDSPVGLAARDIHSSAAPTQ